MKQSVLYIFTRTPLHIGAGSSVGAIDQPIQRERHTGFPIIPGSSIKGVLRDLFVGDAKAQTWLFGSDDAKAACAGAAQFGEGRILAFPVRSAKGCFAWITSPIAQQRYWRDTGAGAGDLGGMPTIGDGETLVAEGPLCLGDGKIVLEEYTFTRKGDVPTPVLSGMEKSMSPTDPVLSQARGRLAMVSDGMMSFFTQAACEVAQHIKIDDETGTVAERALFNQENVPSEALFYSMVHLAPERGDAKSEQRRGAEAAAAALTAALAAAHGVIQLGADGSTGLGYCSVRFDNVAGK
jgi:CRISPR-associated protein Cmr4